MLDTFLFLFPQVILSVYVWSHILHFRWQAEGSQTYIHTRLFLWFWRFPLMFKRVCLKLLTARWTGGSDSLRKTFSILTFNAVFWDLWGVVLLEAPHIHTCVRQISHKCYHKSKDQTCMCLKPLSLSANTKHTHPNIHAKILPTAPT